MSNPVEQDVFSILVVADTESKKETLKSLAQIQNKQAELVKQVEATTISYSEAAEEIRQLNREQLALEGTLEALEDHWKGNNLQLEKYEQRLQSVQRATELTGSINDSIGQLGGAASSLGLTGVGNATGIAQGFGDLLQVFPKLKVQAQTLGEVVRTSTSKVGKLVTSLGDMAGAVVPGSAAIASFTAVLLPVAIALGGVTLAIHNYNKGMEAQNKVLQANLDAVRAVNQSVAEGLTTEQAEQRLEELRRSREAEAETLATAQGAYDSMTSQLQESLGVISGPVLAGIQAFDSREQSLADSIKTSNESITEMDTEIRLLEARLEDGTLAANDAAEAEAALTEERAAAIAQMESEAESIRQQLESSIEQEREMLKERKDAERDASEVQALERKFALEDQQAQEQEHWSNMSKIAADGRSSIQALEKELVDAQGEGLEEINKIEANSKKEIGKLNKDFFEEQLEANREFAKETKQIEEDTKLERLRLMEDINQQMEDAASSNDVNAFLDAQREGAKELKRGAEDASIAEKRRVEDFLKAQEDAQKAYEKQHQEILEATKEEKTAALQGIEERKAVIQQQIEAEKEAIRSAMVEEQKRYDEQERQERQAADRERQRNELADMQENRAFQQRLQQINAQQAAWQSTFNTMTSGIQQLRIEANALAAVAGSVKNSVSQSGNFNNSSFNKMMTNKIGVGERQTMSFNYAPNFASTIGDIASRSEVTNALRGFAETTMTQFVNFVKDAKNG